MLLSIDMLISLEKKNHARVPISELPFHINISSVLLITQKSKRWIGNKQERVLWAKACTNMVAEWGGGEKEREKNV